MENMENTEKTIVNESVFQRLSKIELKTDKKIGLTYVSWAEAWQELKKLYPTANSKVYETPTGMFYWTDGKPCWVKVGVTVEGFEHIEYYPVMDLKNKSVSYENVTSSEVNKAIQRGITKAIARHGLGLYVYNGEDYPEETLNGFLEQAENNKACNKIKEEVIKLINEAMGTPLEEELTIFVTSILPNTRISQATEEHIPALNKIKAFLLEKNANANANK